jgi:hypothetical protein
MSAPVMALVANSKMLPINFSQCDAADSRYQQDQSLSFHPDGPEFARTPHHFFGCESACQPSAPFEGHEMGELQQVVTTRAAGSLCDGPRRIGTATSPRTIEAARSGPERSWCKPPLKKVWLLTIADFHILVTGRFSFTTGTIGNSAPRLKIAYSAMNSVVPEMRAGSAGRDG